MSDLLYQIAITKIPDVGAVSAKNLISYCGGVQAVFEAKARELVKIPGIGETTARKIVHQDVLGEAEKEIEFIEKNKIQTFFYLDKNYPERLKVYNDAPVMLYYKGNTDLNAKRIVAIVGTRKPTIQGQMFCEELVAELGTYNVVIISGLAYGIDVTAHKKCLAACIPTIGVLGHGLSQIYPAQHRQVASEMIHNGGLLTEYTSGAGPQREHFPMRNRIIAGLCDALVVVETATKGGSIISAEIANTYNKDVFAVPGRLKDKYAQGCNRLIKTHKAALLESAADIAYIMRWEKSDNNTGKQQSLWTPLEPQEKLIVDLLNHSESKEIDLLMRQSGLKNSELAAHLLNLEFKGVLKGLPGKKYILV